MDVNIKTVFGVALPYEWNCQDKSLGATIKRFVEDMKDTGKYTITEYREHPSGPVVYVPGIALTEGASVWEYRQALLDPRLEELQTHLDKVDLLAVRYKITNIKIWIS